MPSFFSHFAAFQCINGNREGEGWIQVVCEALRRVRVRVSSVD